MHEEELMSDQELSERNEQPTEPAYQEETDGSHRRTLVAFGVGVAALSGLAVAAVIGGVDTGGTEAFPISTCCINPS
jgi:hypothetical protein